MSETPLEIQTERDEALPLFPDSYAGPILRVKYRPVGRRAWSRFVLVPEPGEGYHELECKAAEAAGARWRSEHE